MTGMMASVRVGEGAIRASVRGSTFMGSLVEYELSVGEASFGRWTRTGCHAASISREEVAVAQTGSKLYALPPTDTSHVAADTEDA